MTFVTAATRQHVRSALFRNGDKQSVRRFILAPPNAYFATLGGRSTVELMFVFVFVLLFAV